MIDYSANSAMNGLKEDGTPIRVLITDDSLAIRRLLEKVLKDNKYEVVGMAENGEVAVQKYGELQPDAVLMDITMPVMNGLEALSAIITQDPKANIVMLTAIGADTEVKAAIKAGAKNYIIKPVTEETIGKVFKVLNQVCQ